MQGHNEQTPNAEGGLCYFPYSAHNAALWNGLELMNEGYRLSSSAPPTLDHHIFNSAIYSPQAHSQQSYLPSECIYLQGANAWYTTPHTNTFQVGTVISPPSVGPYDVCELKVYSLHHLENGRESVRIIGLAAGESLHNIYRVVMTSLGQREDRARLVFHAWVLPDGRVFGNGPRYKDILKNMGNDRELYLNELPIRVGYEFELVFGKCVYLVVIEDIFSGLTDEQDLIWTPRVCEGSYGEAVPFDLCYFPHLFQRPLGAKALAALNANPPVSPADSDSEDSTENDKINPSNSPIAEGLKHLRPTRYRNHYLKPEELDDINALSRMRFIRQNSQIKPLLRKNRPEDYILDEEQRRQCFRMPPRLFFYFLWTQQAAKQVIRPTQISGRSAAVITTGTSVTPTVPYYRNQTVVNNDSTSDATDDSVQRATGISAHTETSNHSSNVVVSPAYDAVKSNSGLESWQQQQQRCSSSHYSSSDDDITSEGEPPIDTTNDATHNTPLPTAQLPHSNTKSTIVYGAPTFSLWNSQQRILGRSGHFFPRCRVSRRMEASNNDNDLAACFESVAPASVKNLSHIDSYKTNESEDDQEMIKQSSCASTSSNDDDCLLASWERSVGSPFEDAHMQSNDEDHEDNNSSALLRMTRDDELLHSSF